MILELDSSIVENLPSGAVRIMVLKKKDRRTDWIEGCDRNDKLGVPVVLVNSEHASTKCPVHEEGVINYVDGRRGVA